MFCSFLLISSNLSFLNFILSAILLSNIVPLGTSLQYRSVPVVIIEPTLLRISKILHFLLSLPFSISSASMSYCINSLYNCFVSLLPILYVVTIISFFAYDTFKIIVIDYCSFLLLILQILFYLFQTIMVFASHSQYFFESTLIFVSSYQVF